MAISAGTWAVINEIGLNQQIDSNSTTQHYKIGKRVRCRDVGTTDYGEAEFIYLKGVASTVAGDAVIYEADGTTIRLVARGEGPVAVAMSACVASEYGWYQIAGLAKVACATVADNTQAYACGTTAAIDDAHVAGDDIKGMRIASADDTGFCKALLMYPAMSDHDNA